MRWIRENPQALDAALARRGEARGMAARLCALDETRRTAIVRAETARAEQNRASQEAGAARARGDDAAFSRLRAMVVAAKDTIAAAQEEARARQAELQDLLMELPNIPHADVPEGEDEDDNKELRRHGRPPSFAFAPRAHYQLPATQQGMDFETAAKLAGSRFMVLFGAVARLHRALAQFMLDIHTQENGMTETWTPILVRDAMMRGTGQLPKFVEDSFIGDWASGRAARLRKALECHSERDIARLHEGAPLAEVIETILERAPTDEGFWLIPTAEVTLTNIVHGMIIDEESLPRRYVAHTQCFRSEAGSAGRDTAGMLRQHQFEKVEMVAITHPAHSRAELERMTHCAEDILRRLELPYRTVVLCTGDMGFGACRTHDIEVWLPGQNRYREISSVSVCDDFQARRMNARFRPKGGGKPRFVHTLNGSGLAVGRCLIALLENGQQEDGSVVVPVPLHPYLGGKSVLTAQGNLA